MNDPRSIYNRLLGERRQTREALQRTHRLVGYGQLGAVGLGAVITWIALFQQTLSIIWVLIPVALFIAMAIRHDRVMRRLEQTRRAESFFEKALARLDGKWAGTGEPGDRYLDPKHPYAHDLDLFGRGSVFELLCTARTHIGEETLARWLLSPADPETVRARHEAIEELRQRLDLREDLAVLAEEARAEVHPLSLAAWGEAPVELEGGWQRVATAAFSVLGAASIVSFFAYDAYNLGMFQISEAAGDLLRDIFLVGIVVNSVWMYRLHRRVDRVVGGVDSAAHQLQLLSAVLYRLERESFQSPLLAALRSSLDSEGRPPSRRVGRLGRLMELLDSRDHLAVRILETFVFWSAHLAFAVETWRKHNGAAVRRWLTATGEIEALCSLASHAFEHQSDVFPEFVAEGPWLEAESVGHPLLAEDRVVRNDVRLGGDLRVLVVSGSNMAGKSTLLRALGTNVVLAQAGAPVRAAKLRLSPLAVGASIQVVDSLQSGVSRFYAEILRLRQILDAASSSLPVLFLIDEVLHGTNSHDRQIGADAVVRGLVKRGAIGLITTHDLALAGIAESLGEKGANVHFEDHIHDGEVRFDYRMRPGVVRKSNAIELMRSVGLEI